MRVLYLTGMVVDVNDSDISISYGMNMNQPPAFAREGAIVHIKGIGKQLVVTDLRCPYHIGRDFIQWLNYHLHKSQEVSYEFTPYRKKPTALDYKRVNEN